MPVLEQGPYLKPQDFRHDELGYFLNGDLYGPPPAAPPPPPARAPGRPLPERGPWDAVLRAQHGAAVADGFPDADGEIVSRVRALVGPKIPIGLSLDLHTNLSQRMVDGAPVPAPYR